MDVLIVSQYFWPESFRINDLAIGLAERGHKVSVLTAKPNYPNGKFYPGYKFLSKGKEKYGPITIIRSPVIPRGKNNFQLLLNYLSFAFFASLIGLIKCRRPDVIFVYQTSPITVGLPAIFLKKIKKVPIIFWVQDLWPDTVIALNIFGTRFLIKCLRKLVNFIYQRCDRILTTSTGYFDSIKTFNIHNDKLCYFPQTAEDFYQPIKLTHNSEEDKILPQGFRVLFSGNIGFAQGIENILNTAEILRGKAAIKWIFLGEGSKRVWLQEEIKKRKLTDTVHWLGHYPATAMPKFFSCADILLVTLKKDPVFSLTVPAKIQSYLACGKPIVGALDGEGRRIIEEAEAGYVAKSDDAKELATNIIKMQQLDAGERAQFGLNGRKYFETNFQRDKLLQQLESLMMNLIKRSNA